MTALNVPFRTYAFKPTKHIWYSEFSIADDKRFTDTRFVKVTCLEYLNSKPNENGWCVSIWGNDDTGVEKTFRTKKEALRLYRTLVSLETIPHMITLKETYGMVPA